MVRVHLGLPSSQKWRTTEKKQTLILYGGVAQLGEHLPCKQGVMGSNPIISTKTQKSLKQMLIENRIKYNETKQIVVYWEKLVRKILKVFPYNSGWSENSNQFRPKKDREILQVDKKRELWNQKGLLIYNPNNYLRSSSKKAEFCFRN